MRLTKKMVREAKIGMIKRINELALKTEEELRAEVNRCFPGMEVTGGTSVEMLRYMTNDVIDRSLPDHWLH